MSQPPNVDTDLEEKFQQARKVMDGIPFETKDFDRAEDFVDGLISTKSPWGRATDEWCFRGQWRGDKGLTASLWRENAKARFGGILGDTEVLAIGSSFSRAPTLDPRQRSIAGLLLSEKVAAQRFLVEADRLGLRVPLDASDLDILKRDADHGTWLRDVRENLNRSIPYSLLEAYALAQHHGIPTQLLDFTTDPLIAAYFAVPSPLPPLNSFMTSPARLAVWGVHRTRIEQPGSEIRFIDAPRGNNHYLRTQRGLFMLDTTAARDLSSGEVETLPCMTRHMRMGVRIQADRSFPKIISCWKYTLPLKSAHELADILTERGIRKSSLMPTFDNVAADVMGGSIIRTFGAIGA